MSTDVSTEWIALTAADGHRFDAYRAAPRGTARGALVVLPEIFGINPHIRRVCDGFAAAGYATLAPALFDRTERKVELGYDDAGRTRGIALMTSMDTEKTLLDVQAALAELGDAAVVGYCWGGSLAWLAAARLPVRAAVGYYGGQIGKTLDLVPKAPTLLHFGEKDQNIPLSVAEGVRQRHPAVIVHTYPAGHGFNCDERASFDADSAALALRRTLGLLDAAF